MAVRSPKRSEVSQEFKWKINDIYADDEAWEQDLLKAKSAAQRIAGYKGMLCTSAEKLLEYMRYDDELTVLLEDLINYAQRRNDEDTRVSKYQDMVSRVETVLAVLPLVAMLVVFGALDGLTQSGNWSTFFLVVGGLTLLGGVLGIFFLREKKQTQRSDEPYFANIIYGLRPSVIRANPALYISLAALAIYSMSQ